MAPANGRSHSALSQRLTSDTRRFDFFQAVRLLHRVALEAARNGQSASSFQRPIGTDESPDREVVRFRSLPSLSFPVSSLDDLQEQVDEVEHSKQPEMTVTFMGLAGPNGVLPRHYTSLLIERLRDKDFSLRDFLDLFNHRLVSLFYRAWEKYRFPIGYERSKLDPASDEDPFTTSLYALIGFGTGGLRGRMDVPDEVLLYYSGALTHSPRSAVALERVLADYFGVEVHIQQFQGQWLFLNPTDRSRMPGPDAPKGINNSLGRTVILGESVWDIQSMFRIRLGPLTYAQFCRFLPEGDALRPLCQLVRTYIGPEFDFQVQPVLLAREIPRCRLGDRTGVPFRTGRNIWSLSQECTEDFDRAFFSLPNI